MVQPIDLDLVNAAAGYLHVECSHIFFSKPVMYYINFYHINQEAAGQIHIR